MKAVNIIYDNFALTLLEVVNGNRQRRVIPEEYTAFVDETNLTDEQREAFVHLIFSKNVEKTETVGKYTKIYWVNKRTYETDDKGRRKHVRQVDIATIESYGIEVLEGDVSPAKRFMIENDVQIQAPRRAYIDIETDSRCSFEQARNGHARILSWAIVDDHGRREVEVLKADTDFDEKYIIDKFWNILEDYDQIVAWNGDNFDFPVLVARSERMELKRNFRMWLFLDQMMVFKRNNTMSAESGDEKQSYKLNDIAMALLGEGKEEVSGSKTWEYWEAGGEKRDQLASYNLQDTVLLKKIEDKTGYIALFQTLAEVCGVFPDSRGLKPTVQVDMFMMRLGNRHNIRFKTQHYGDEVSTDKFRGAYVMSPKCVGITKNVHVADFASLYPSIMITWNLSPETKLAARIPDSCVSPGNNLITRTDVKGILPTALEELLSLRAEWTKKRSEVPPGTPEAKECERRTNSYKTAANSFYGVMGTPYSRFFDKELAEATTQNGVWLIHKTIEEAEKLGMNSIYSDTDSCFIQGFTKEEFSNFSATCNSVLYPKLLSECGCVNNKIKLAYEKQFERIVFTAMKRYVARIQHYKGKERTDSSKPEIKGIEFKRGDTNKIARELQSDVIDLFDKCSENPEDYLYMVTDYMKRILTSNLSVTDVRISKAISQDLSEYSQRTRKDGQIISPSHVKLARAMQQSGEEISVGTRINYFVTDASTSPMTVDHIEKFDGTNADRYYLWENLVWPPTYRLLAAMFPTYSWEKYNKVRPSKKFNPDQMVLI